jgi:hypothetical protein
MKRVWIKREKQVLILSLSKDEATRPLFGNL